MTDVVDFTLYRETGHRVEWGSSLGQALHDIDKANRAAEECIAMFRPKMADFFKPLFGRNPHDAA
jgi:hypothetical protein